MAVQIITVRSSDPRHEGVLFEERIKHRKIADAVAANWELVNSILESDVNCGGSFGLERKLALFTGVYTMHFNVEAR